MTISSHLFIDYINLNLQNLKCLKIYNPVTLHCTEMRFASLFSGGFTTIAVINQPERKLAKRSSVHCTIFDIQRVLA